MSNRELELKRMKEYLTLYRLFSFFSFFSLSSSWHVLFSGGGKLTGSHKDNEGTHVANYQLSAQAAFFRKYEHLEHRTGLSRKIVKKFQSSIRLSDYGILRKKSNIIRHRGLNPGPPESRALPRSQLARSFYRKLINLLKQSLEICK